MTYRHEVHCDRMGCSAHQLTSTECDKLPCGWKAVTHHGNSDHLCQMCAPVYDKVFEQHAINLRAFWERTGGD